MSADLYNRLQLFGASSRRGGGDEDEEDRGDGRRTEEAVADPETSGVRRCLFGRGDPEENIRFAKRELERSLCESKRRWNFDFEADKPLNGRYEWESPAKKRLGLDETSTSCSSKHKEEEEEEEQQNNPSSVEKPPPKQTLSPEKLQSDHPGLSCSTATSSSSQSSKACDTSGKEENTLSSTTNATAATASTSQRSSHSHQPPMTDHFKQRKRSKSKVKVQERKPESEQDENVAAAAPPALEAKQN